MPRRSRSQRVELAKPALVGLERRPRFTPGRKSAPARPTSQRNVCGRDPALGTAAVHRYIDRTTAAPATSQIPDTTGRLLLTGDQLLDPDLPSSDERRGQWTSVQ